MGDALKLNNKGFAISSIMYIILVLAVILISLILVTLSSRKLILDKLRDEALENIYYVSPCKLVSDVDNSKTITPGDKYQCKVKDEMEKGYEDGYYFFVLSNNHRTTNLIMERNMYYDEENNISGVADSNNPGFVPWYASSSDPSYGPVTAMIYLHNVTKDWNNVPNMVIDYKDENIDPITGQKGTTGTTGYGAIKTTGNITVITSNTGEETGRIENLKARMPRYDEVAGIGKCLSRDENEYKFGSCPIWLSNYLRKNEYVSGEGLKNIEEIIGYWVLSSYASKSNFAWYVDYRGLIGDHTVNSDLGVRPVITLKL